MRTGLPLIKRLWLQSRPGDWLMVFLFVASAAGSFWLGGVGASDQATNNLIAVVTVDHWQVTTRRLVDSCDFVVHGALGEMLLQVTNRRIRVLRSTCPNQICVRQNAAYRPGEMLVCVPNRVVIFICHANEANFTKTPVDSVTLDKSTADTPTSDYDAVTF